MIGQTLQKCDLEHAGILGMDQSIRATFDEDGTPRRATFGKAGTLRGASFGKVEQSNFGKAGTPRRATSVKPGLRESDHSSDRCCSRIPLLK
ncbi:MAG: hypothetical protein K6T85_11080 [Gorillibacterium sp.]|nr:hypothetical protein [Gorillibacterium sp.]